MFEDIIKKTDSANDKLIGNIDINIYELHPDSTFSLNTCKKCGYNGSLYVKAVWTENGNQKTDSYCFECFRTAIKNMK